MQVEQLDCITFREFRIEPIQVNDKKPVFRDRDAGPQIDAFIVKDLQTSLRRIA